MKVSVTLFALLGKHFRSGAPADTVEIDGEAGPQKKLVPDTLGVLPEHCRFGLANGNDVEPFARNSWTLKRGDALAVWSPVAGG